MSKNKKENKSLGLAELIAIALGGMVGGGIFTVLGLSVTLIGNLTPVSIIIGGLIAYPAGYSFVKLGLYYRAEGASFTYLKKSYPHSHFVPSIIGWFVIFGYISTLALYAYTFSSYAISGFAFAQSLWLRKGIAIAIIAVFTAINAWSVNGMGKIEDIMVYTKLVILLAISVVLMKFGAPNFADFSLSFQNELTSTPLISVLMVSSITFVAYEGFQLVNNASDEMRNPEKNIGRAIYTAIFLAILIYFVIAVGALLSIPAKDIIANKEYALAAGAGNVLGNFGKELVIFGAVLATSSAISGTLFGASRQLAVIADDGYFPRFLTVRKKDIPLNAILSMAGMSSILVLVGGLELILEFGSITFLIVCLLTAIANYKMRRETKSSAAYTLFSIAVMTIGGLLILYYEFTHELTQMIVILILYVVLATGAYLFAKKRMKTHPKTPDQQ